MPAPTPDYINDGKMYELREEGLSLAAIGRQFPDKQGKPLSRERVRQRIDRYEEYQVYSEIYSLFDHNTKVARLLLRNHIKNASDLKSADLEKLEKKKGAGRKTIAWITQVRESLQ